MAEDHISWKGDDRGNLEAEPQRSEYKRDFDEGAYCVEDIIPDLCKHKRLDSCYYEQERGGSVPPSRLNVYDNYEPHTTGSVSTLRVNDNDAERGVFSELPLGPQCFDKAAKSAVQNHVSDVDNVSIDNYGSMVDIDNDNDNKNDFELDIRYRFKLADRILVNDRNRNNFGDDEQRPAGHYNMDRKYDMNRHSVFDDMKNYDRDRLSKMERSTSADQDILSSRNDRNYDKLYRDYDGYYEDFECINNIFNESSNMDGKNSNVVYDYNDNYACRKRGKSADRILRGDTQRRRDRHYEISESTSSTSISARVTGTAGSGLLIFVFLFLTIFCRAFQRMTCCLYLDEIILINMKWMSNNYQYKELEMDPYIYHNTIHSKNQMLLNRENMNYGICYQLGEHLIYNTELIEAPEYGGVINLGNHNQCNLEFYDPDNYQHTPDQLDIDGSFIVVEVYVNDENKIKGYDQISDLNDSFTALIYIGYLLSDAQIVLDLYGSKRQNEYNGILYNDVSLSLQFTCNGDILFDVNFSSKIMEISLLILHDIFGYLELLELLTAELCSTLFSDGDNDNDNEYKLYNIDTLIFNECYGGTHKNVLILDDLQSTEIEKCKNIIYHSNQYKDLMIKRKKHNQSQSNNFIHSILRLLTNFDDDITKESSPNWLKFVDDEEVVNNNDDDIDIDNDDFKLSINHIESERDDEQISCVTIKEMMEIMDIMDDEINNNNNNNKNVQKQIENERVENGEKLRNELDIKINDKLDIEIKDILDRELIQYERWTYSMMNCIEVNVDRNINDVGSWSLIQNCLNQKDDEKIDKIIDRDTLNITYYSWPNDLYQLSLGDLNKISMFDMSIYSNCDLYLELYDIISPIRVDDVINNIWFDLSNYPRHQMLINDVYQRIEIYINLELQIAIKVQDELAMGTFITYIETMRICQKLQKLFLCIDYHKTFDYDIDNGIEVSDTNNKLNHIIKDIKDFRIEFRRTPWFLIDAAIINMIHDNNMEIQWISVQVVDAENNWIVIRFINDSDDEEQQKQYETNIFLNEIQTFNWNLCQTNDGKNSLFKCFYAEIYGQERTGYNGGYKQIKREIEEYMNNNNDYCIPDIVCTQGKDYYVDCIANIDCKNKLIYGGKAKSLTVKCSYNEICNGLEIFCPETFVSECNLIGNGYDACSTSILYGDHHNKINIEASDRYSFEYSTVYGYDAVEVNLNCICLESCYFSNIYVSKVINVNIMCYNNGNIDNNNNTDYYHSPCNGLNIFASLVTNNVNICKGNYSCYTENANNVIVSGINGKYGMKGLYIYVSNGPYLLKSVFIWKSRQQSMTKYIYNGTQCDGIIDIKLIVMVNEKCLKINNEYIALEIVACRLNENALDSYKICKIFDNTNVNKVVSFWDTYYNYYCYWFGNDKTFKFKFNIYTLLATDIAISTDFPYESILNIISCGEIIGNKYELNDISTRNIWGNNGYYYLMDTLNVHGEEYLNILFDAANFNRFIVSYSYNSLTVSLKPEQYYYSQIITKNDFYGIDCVTNSNDTDTNNNSNNNNNNDNCWYWYKREISTEVYVKSELQIKDICLECFEWILQDIDYNIDDEEEIEKQKLLSSSSNALYCICRKRFDIKLAMIGLNNNELSVDDKLKFKCPVCRVEDIVNGVNQCNKRKEKEKETGTTSGWLLDTGFGKVSILNINAIKLSNVDKKCGYNILRGDCYLIERTDDINNAIELEFKYIDLNDIDYGNDHSYSLEIASSKMVTSRHGNVRTIILALNHAASYSITPLSINDNNKKYILSSKLIILVKDDIIGITINRKINISLSTIMDRDYNEYGIVVFSKNNDDNDIYKKLMILYDDKLNKKFKVAPGSMIGGNHIISETNLNCILLAVSYMVILLIMLYWSLYKIEKINDKKVGYKEKKRVLQIKLVLAENEKERKELKDNKEQMVGTQIIYEVLDKLNDERNFGFGERTNGELILCLFFKLFVIFRTFSDLFKFLVYLWEFIFFCFYLKIC